MLADEQQHRHQRRGGAHLVVEKVKVGTTVLTSATAKGPTFLADWMISASAGSARAVKSRRLCVSLAAGPSSTLSHSPAAVIFRRSAGGPGGELVGRSGAVLAR